MAKKSSHNRDVSTSLTRRLLITTTVMLSGIVVAVCAWWWLHDYTDRYDPFAGIRVEREISGIPNGLKIGVVVSYTENTFEGAGWDGNGEGITIAKWRLAQAGTPVDTLVVSDQGSKKGAVAAVKELANEHVSGIIALTNGPHTSELAKAATEAGLPIIFPYQNAPKAPAKGTWYGFEENTTFAKNFQTRISKLGCVQLVSIGPAPNNIKVDETITGQGTAEQVNNLLNQSAKGCVILNGPSSQMANQTQMLRAKGINAPIIVGISGANSEFISVIAKTNSNVSSIYAISTPTLVHGDAWIGFDQARTLAAGSNAVESLRKDTSFNERSSLADASSYEAFMSIVTASAQAQTTNPLKVSDTLARLRIPTEQSVDGVERDFTTAIYQHSSLVQLVPIGSAWQWVEYK